jgi:hypothetical protein
MISKIKAGIVAGGLIVSLGLTGCSSDADTASENVSKAADNFEVQRKVVFFNGITDKYLLSIEGRCSVKNESDQKKLSVVCKTGENTYKKHLLGLSDNVSYFVEQADGVKVSAYHYRVIFKPESVIPNIDMKTEGK